MAVRKLARGQQGFEPVERRLRDRAILFQHGLQPVSYTHLDVYKRQQELGTDFTRNHHEAINEDGSPYDDDVGGPCYVGGRDAVELTPLDAENDAIARQLAEEMFDRIRERGDT